MIVIRDEFVKAYVHAFASATNDKEAKDRAATDAAHEIQQNTPMFVMFKLAILAAERDMPKVYLSSNADGIDIAAYPCEHPDQIELDSYTMELVELRQLERVAKERTHHISLNVLSNILGRAGVRVVIE
jgi:hypothetical protein